MSGSSETASKIRLKTSAFTRSRKRLNPEFQFPKPVGKSRHGLPVRAIQSTPASNTRPSPRCGRDQSPCSDTAAPTLRPHLRPLKIRKDEPGQIPEILPFGSLNQRSVQNGIPNFNRPWNEQVRLYKGPEQPWEASIAIAMGEVEVGEATGQPLVDARLKIHVRLSRQAL